VIRQELERRLPDLTDGEWSLLDEDGHVAEAESGAADLDYLVERVRRLRQAVGQPPKREPAAELARAEELARRATSRAEALSALLAAEASQDTGVVKFRREELRGRLIKPERVGAWVDRHAKPATQLLTVSTENPDEPLEHSVRMLEYATPPAAWVLRVGVALNSPLERLRALSESLANRHAWQPAQASVFVLTGLVPILAPIRARTTIRYPIPAASRITLDVDPTVTPREVAEHYAATRKGMLAGRSRRMSEKHLRLAIYAATHSEGTWAERMHGWNKAHPDASYGLASNFQRDATKAVKRLLDPLDAKARQ
jgi:hypothetical protein